MIRQALKDLTDNSVMLGSPSSQLVFLQQPLYRRCKLCERRDEQPETRQKAIYVLNIPNGPRHVVGIYSCLQLCKGGQAAPPLELIAKHFHATDQEM